MARHRRPELRHALGGGGRRVDDLGPPGAGPRQVEHLLEVAPGLAHARPVGLVDDEDVGDLEEAGLVGLHRVAPARGDDDDRGVGGRRDLDLHLADADGLDDHDPDARRAEQPDGVGHGQRQTAQVAPRRHGADEDGRVERVLAHADAVAEDGAAAERRRRVDGQHRRPAGPAPAPRDARTPTPTAGHPPRTAVMRPSVSVDLPAPGAPVRPSV